jgi:hypothetical protein
MLSQAYSIHQSSSWRRLSITILARCRVKCILSTLLKRSPIQSSVVVLLWILCRKRTIVVVMVLGTRMSGGLVAENAKGKVCSDNRANDEQDGKEL